MASATYFLCTLSINLVSGLNNYAEGALTLCSGHKNGKIFIINRHETFQIFGRLKIFYFQNMFCRITCFCLKIAKMTFLERVTGVFRFFT